MIKRRTLYLISAHVYSLEKYAKNGSLKSLMGPPTLLPSSASSSAALTSSASSPAALEAAVPCLVVSSQLRKLVLKNAKKAAFNKDVSWNTFNARLFHPNIQDIMSIPIQLKHLIRTEISTTATTFLEPKNQDEAQSVTRELNTEASAKGKKFNT